MPKKTFFGGSSVIGGSCEGFEAAATRVGEGSGALDVGGVEEMAAPPNLLDAGKEGTGMPDLTAVVFATTVGEPVTKSDVALLTRCCCKNKEPIIHMIGIIFTRVDPGSGSAVWRRAISSRLHGITHMYILQYVT